MAYQIVVKPKALKEIERRSLEDRKRIAEEFDLLAAHPRPPGVKKLKGRVDVWRTRVGTIRILYTIDDGAQIITIVGCPWRDKAY